MELDFMRKIIFVLLCLTIFTIKVEAKRGCCSHHGGVNGCNSNGRTICNDGTLSPSCTCTPTIEYIYGCTDKTAKNFNPNANRSNGKCTYYIYGCTDKNAKNYNPKAERDNGTCEYYILGCMDKEAKNYNPAAEKSNNTCEYYIHGCTDKTALNYNELAEKNDGSCKYPEPEPTKAEQNAKQDLQEETSTKNEQEKDTSTGIITTIGAIITTATIFCVKKKII